MADYFPEDFGAVGNAFVPNPHDDWQALTDMVTAAETISDQGMARGPTRFILSSKQYGIKQPWLLRPKNGFNFTIEGAGASNGGSWIVPIPGFTGIADGGTRSAIYFPGEVAGGDSHPHYAMRGLGVVNLAGSVCESGIRWCGVSDRLLGGVNGVGYNPIEDISVTDFTYNFDIRNVTLLEFNRCSTSAEGIANAFGFFLFAVNDKVTSDLRFNTCGARCNPTNGAAIGLFNSTLTGGLSGIQFEKFTSFAAAVHVLGRLNSTGNMSNVRFSNCQLDGGNGGFDLLANGGSHNEDINIIGTSFRGSGIPYQVQGVNGSQFMSLKIEQSQLLNNGGRTFLSGIRGGSFSHNSMYGCTAPGLPAIHLNNSQSVNILGNHMVTDFRPPPPSFLCTVQVDAGCGSFNVDGNNSGDVPMSGGLPGNINNLAGGAGTIGLNR